MKLVSILVGLSGSGKSTYREVMSPDVYFNADEIREELYGDPKIQGNPREVFGLLFERYQQALLDPSVYTICIDNTSLTYDLRKQYYVDNPDVKFQLVVFQPNLERSLSWNKKRDRFVPEDVIEAQFKRFQYPNDIERKRCEIIEIGYFGEV